jgi:hypothetical protein
MLVGQAALAIEPGSKRKPDGRGSERGGGAEEEKEKRKEG